MLRSDGIRARKEERERGSGREGKGKGVTRSPLHILPTERSKTPAPRAEPHTLSALQNCAAACTAVQHST